MVAFAIKSTLGDQVSLEEIYKGSLPFLLMMGICVVLLVIFPEIVLWLPHLGTGTPGR
jgi:TRAP-type mannitol/chloroaromatic compound transport system permease large subunit